MIQWKSHCRYRADRGSIVVVILIAVVLVVLGGIALAMSTSFGRSGYHEKLVAESQDLARAAVEEAAMLINNGKRNVEIDTALGSMKPVEVKIAELKDSDSPLANLPADQAPKVFVKAAIVDPSKTVRDTATAQYQSITKQLMDDQAREFWERVDKEGLHDKESGADTSADDPNCFVNGWVKHVGIDGWHPKWQKVPEPVKTETLSDGVTVVKYYKWVMKRPMGELFEVFKLFRTVSGDLDGGEKVLKEGDSPCIDVKTNGGKPSLGEFKQKWEAAIKAVGCDAAKKVEACGANPSLAMAHLVGDLKLGEEIASGAEVKATADFMRDSVIGTNKTYLLEISSSMGYEGYDARMKGKQAFRSYRLFQKAEWEMAMKMMADHLAMNLQNQGGASLSPSDLAQLFPADKGVKERDEPVPDKSCNPTSSHYDPKKMFDDVVYSEMPSTVGTRLYPYGVASMKWDPNRLQEKDADKTK
ncbi:MAG: hypothetical protein HY814_14505 [Candidatus Riflebacteria bacterium]|nr:hypothetical protein [Candidatus Riflebacteria bacterium]